MQIEFLTDAGALPDDVRRSIGKIARTTADEARTHLPGLPDRLVLLVYAGENVIAETGDNGIALAPGVCAWTVHPGHPAGVANIVARELRATLLHELHHIARGFVLYPFKPVATFMHHVVAEGLATAFERDVGRRVLPWGAYPENVDAWVDELLSLPPDAPYADWMFSHPDGRRWVGYRAGTYIADKAMAGSGKSAAHLASTSTADILRFAGIEKL